MLPTLIYTIEYVTIGRTLIKKHFCNDKNQCYFKKIQIFSSLHLSFRNMKPGEPITIGFMSQTYVKSQFEK
jgi:hypothetical protein